MERAAKAKEGLQHNNNGAGRKDKEEVTDRSDDDDVTEKVAGGKVNLAITGSMKLKSSSSKSSCGDAEALGKLEVIAINHKSLFSFSFSSLLL